MAAPPENRGRFPARPGPLSRLGDFWHQLSEGRDLDELWRQFHSEAQASYSLYSRDVDWSSLENLPRHRRALKIGGALFWALVKQLSPPRRILLMVALLFSLIGLLGLRPFGWPRESYIVVGTGLLLLLLALELADRVVMKRDLQIARDIQRWLVPSAAPEVAGYDIAFATRPANTVSGDYYDAFLREVAGESSKRLEIVVADVAGKSVPAALLMATFQASLRTLAEALPSLLDLVAGLNRYACAHSLGGRRFTTAFLADIDPATGAVSYINAGHNAPILRRGSGEMERLETGGLPLGIRGEGGYECGTTSLEAGDLLIVFTDGVVEAEDAHGQQFEESRLLAFTRANTDQTAAKTLAALMAFVDRFVAGAPQHDDLTCLVVRRG
jgi:sigma-B regulation protein RsbU (phosphoserine phosphatase)